MKHRGLKYLATVTTVLVAMGCVTSQANAAFVISAAVGGVPTGVTYVNFNDLTPGSGGGSAGPLTVSFTGDGGAVTGNSSGLYAAPYISGSNGVLFGDGMVAGQDASQYVTTGIGTVTLVFPGLEKYLGLLWGSVDDFNSLAFYSGTTLVGTVNGLDITASANGDQGINGTLYANIVSDLAFDSVVASSTAHAFEFDNVAFNVSDPTTPVPAPFSLGLLGMGICTLGAIARRRNKSIAA